MKAKKTKNSKTGNSESVSAGEISTSSDLKSFLHNVRDKMTEQVAAPVYALSAMNFIMNLPNIYKILDNECKELARDIWLRLRQSGLQIKNPPLLFGAEEAQGTEGNS